MKKFSEEELKRQPPGQHLTTKFPVLHEGKPMAFHEASWRLKIHGSVAKPVVLAWPDLAGLPTIESVSDFHCVTSWSRLDNVWKGIAFQSISELVQPTAEARFVRFADHQGYDTSLPIELAMDADVLLATQHDGQVLCPDHGGPLRAVVPKRYGWKSCKWLAEIEFLAQDKLGYWEQRGYHNNADPWAEERFSS